MWISDWERPSWESGIEEGRTDVMDTYKRRFHMAMQGECQLRMTVEEARSRLCRSIWCWAAKLGSAPARIWSSASLGKLMICSPDPIVHFFFFLTSSPYQFRHPTHHCGFRHGKQLIIWSSLPRHRSKRWSKPRTNAESPTPPNKWRAVSALRPHST